MVLPDDKLISNELLYLYDLKWKLIEQMKSEEETEHLDIELREVQYWIDRYLESSN